MLNSILTHQVELALRTHTMAHGKQTRAELVTQIHMLEGSMSVAAELGIQPGKVVDAPCDGALLAALLVRKLDDQVDMLRLAYDV